MEVAATTVLGAAVGAVFKELFANVIKATKKATKFKSVFRDLESTLEAYQILVNDIEKVGNNVEPLQGLDAFKTKMEEGIQLVHKCSNIHPLQLKLNFFKKYKYVKKLGALDISLQTLLRLVRMHVEVNRMARASNLQMLVNRIDRNMVMQNLTENQIRGWCAVPKPPSFTVGLDEPLKDLKMKFLNDDQVSMLVLTGPGGCGKTTLTQMFCQDEEVKEKFKKKIFFVTVSEKPNLDRIVEEICRSIGSQVPAFQNEANALTWLQEFLTETGKEPLLLVLDDVWLGSSESLLDKCHEFKRSNYKILVTSRFQFPRFCSSYELNPLKDEDAMDLFLDTTSLKDGEFDIPIDLVTKIVKLCKGFPLAITVIGRDLCNKPVEIWVKRVTELSKGSSILDSEKLLLDRLQSSLNALDKGAVLVKECFIDLGSFPEDQKIPAVVLIDMWSELYDLQDSSSIAYLHDLNARSLANLIVTRNEKRGANGYYSEHFVTQHDILRSLAIHQTGHDPIGQFKRLILDICGDVAPNWWTEQKQKPKKTRLLSISTDGAFSSKWHNMHLPKAEVMVLHFQTKNYAFPKFKKKLSKSLKVLIVTNCGVLPAEVSNFTSLGSLSKLKRMRLECISIPSITKNCIELKSLHKLSLFMCNIAGAFSNNSIRFFEAFPNLEEMNIDYCGDLVELPADLCILIHLKKLSITNSPKLSALPENIGELVNLEVLRLMSCTELSELPSSVRKLEKLKFLDISNCFSIKELPEYIGEVHSLEKLNMMLCSRLKELPASILDLERLTEVICDEDTERLWKDLLPSLKNIQIRVVKEEFNLNWLEKLHSN